MAKEEIAHHEQFHLWPQCSLKSSADIASESVCMWERVNEKVDEGRPNDGHRAISVAHHVHFVLR